MSLGPWLAAGGGRKVVKDVGMGASGGILKGELFQSR